MALCCLFSFYQCVRVLVEIHCEDKERRRKRDQRPSKPHNSPRGNLCDLGNTKRKDVASQVGSMAVHRGCLDKLNNLSWLPFWIKQPCLLIGAVSGKCNRMCFRWHKRVATTPNKD